MKLLLVVCVTASVVLGGWLMSMLPSEPVDDRARTAREPQLVAADSSGNGNHGVNQGTPRMGLPGQSGTSYSFDAPGSWVQVPSNETLNPGRKDFLLTAWVNFSQAPALGETYDIVRKGLAWTPTGEFKLEIISRGRIKCSAKDSEGHVAWVIGPDQNVADGQWHRIGCARTGSSWSVIVDDTITSKLTEMGSIGNTMPLSIGSKYGREDVPQGRVDEVRLVVSDDPRDGTGRGLGRRGRLDRLEQADPVAWWRLDEAQTTAG